MKNIILPNEAREYILYQRTEILPEYQLNIAKKILEKLKIKNYYKDFIKENAFKKANQIDEEYIKIMEGIAINIMPHIPSDTKNIMDIGCGMGLLSLLLYRYLNEPELKLIDKTKIEDEIYYNYEKKGAYYNSLDIAKKLLIKNYVKEDKIKLIEAPENGVIEIEKNSIDLIISTISWGFHYPVKTYLESVDNILKDDGIVIIDIRKETGGEQELMKKFTIETIYEAEKYNRYKCKKTI
jgi:SAM-dependent methyltransferase